MKEAEYLMKNYWDNFPGIPLPPPPPNPHFLNVKPAVSYGMIA